LDHRALGPSGPVSVLTLGGGGLGQVWGETSRHEAVATVAAAVDSGIDLLDLAPLYGRGESERVVFEAFGGNVPDHVRVSTKVMLGEPTEESATDRIRRSLERSLATLGTDRVDFCFLHSYIVDDDRVLPQLGEFQHRRATTWTTYADAWRPTMTALVDDGTVGAWGITGTGPPATVLTALRDEPRPAAVQVIANLLDSAAEIRRYDEPAQPREIIGTAVDLGIGVLGIRAVGAGAITDALDRPLPDDDPVALDFRRCDPVREIAADLGLSTAALAHRYALTMSGVDSVVLGVKNREELADCVAAATAGPLSGETVRRIDAAVPRP
jgi:aryl-alcohol dehydrogenase-like predicted oxidoreductase